jgi:hypothetical protein
MKNMESWFACGIWYNITNVAQYRLSDIVGQNKAKVEILAKFGNFPG